MPITRRWQRETVTDMLTKRLEKSVERARCAKAGHPERSFTEGRTADTGEFYRTYYCETCDTYWTEWECESEDLP